jgi:hypothetical protein
MSASKMLFENPMMPNIFIKENESILVSYVPDRLMSLIWTLESVITTGEALLS